MNKETILRRISYIGLALLILLLVALAGRGIYGFYTSYKMKKLPTVNYKFGVNDTELITLHDTLIIGGIRYYPEVKGGVNYYAPNEAQGEKISEYWGGGVDNRIFVDSVKVQGILNILDGLDLAKIEQDKKIDAIHERESYNGKRVWLTLQTSSKSYNLHIFDRYIYAYTPWDEVETVYYIQNFDKDNTPEDLIMAIAG